MGDGCVMSVSAANLRFVALNFLFLTTISLVYSPRTTNEKSAVFICFV